MDDNTAMELSLEYDRSSAGSEQWIDFKERSQRGEDYYCGLQTFDDETKDRLRREGKPWLVFNEILPITNYLTSTERSNRKDHKVEKRRGGYEAVAELATELSKHALDQCNGDFVKSQVFLDGVRGCRGNFKLEIDFERDPVNGQIILRARPPLAVRYDPCGMTYDINEPNGCQFVVDTEYIPREKLMAQYPDKADEIEKATDSYTESRHRSLLNKVVDWVTGTTVVEDDNDEVLFDRDIMNRWRCRRTEVWFREYVNRTMVCDLRNWEVRFLDPAKKKEKQNIDDIKAVAQRHPDTFIVKDDAMLPVLHVVRRIGDLMLEHVEDPFNGLALFPIIPFSPLGQAQYDMGVIDNLVGPQDELNKRMTNAVHILQQTANGGWIVNQLDAGYIDVLRNYGASPNIVLEKNKCGGHLEKIQPNILSPGHMQLQAIDRNYLEEISGVTGSSRGYEPERQESGLLYREKVKQSMSTNQVIYDRFDQSTQIMAYTLVEMIRRTSTYRDEEIAQIIDDKDLLDEEMMAAARQRVAEDHPPPNLGQMIDQMTFTQLAPENQQIIKDLFLRMVQEYRQTADAESYKIARQVLMEQFRAYRTGKYSVVVIASPNAPTTQMSNFFELVSLKEVIPPPIIAPALIQTSGLPKPMKDELIKKIEILTQAQMAPPAPPGAVPQPQAAGMPAAA